MAPKYGAKETSDKPSGFTLISQAERLALARQILWICAGDAGWSSPVARQAHNLKAAGSNPAPATNLPLKSIIAEAKHKRQSPSVALGR